MANYKNIIISYLQITLKIKQLQSKIHENELKLINICTFEKKTKKTSK